jgi:hypothetical protein
MGFWRVSVTRRKSFRSAFDESVEGNASSCFLLFWFSFSIYLGQFPVFGDFRVDGRDLLYSYVLFFFLLLYLHLHFCFVFRDIRLFPFPPSLFVALVGCGFLVGAVAFSTLDDPFIAL